MAKFTCSCGARYKFPDSAIGKRAKCKKCGEVFTLEVEDEGIFALADEPVSSPQTHIENPVTSEGVNKQPPQGETFTAAGHPVYRGLSASEPEATKIASHSFASNIVRTFLFPTSPSNLINFFILWFIMMVGLFASFMPRIGTMLTMIVIGWFSAYRFMVLSSAAAGEDDIPDVGASFGSWLEYLGYFFKWLGSWAIVMLPVLIYIVVVMVQSGETPFTIVLTVIYKLGAMTGSIGGLMDISGSDLGLYDALVYVGMFIWPMIILCIALGGFSAFHQPDLIVKTIFKTFHVYVFIVMLILGVVIGQATLQEIIASAFAKNTPATVTGIFGSSVLLGVLLVGLSVYFDIVLMRMIGLFYYHFKDKFAWSWG